MNVSDIWTAASSERLLLTFDRIQTPLRHHMEETDLFRTSTPNTNGHEVVVLSRNKDREYPAYLHCYKSLVLLLSMREIFSVSCGNLYLKWHCLIWSVLIWALVECAVFLPPLLSVTSIKAEIHCFGVWIMILEWELEHVLPDMPMQETEDKWLCGPVSLRSEVALSRL